MGVFPEHMFVYHICLSGTFGDQKKLSDPLKLELQTVVSRHVCVGNGIWALWKSSSCSSLLSHLSRLSLIIYLDLNSYL